MPNGESRDCRSAEREHIVRMALLVAISLEGCKLPFDIQIFRHIQLFWSWHRDSQADRTDKGRSRCTLRSLSSVRHIWHIHTHTYAWVWNAIVCIWMIKWSFDRLVSSSWSIVPFPLGIFSHFVFDYLALYFQLNVPLAVSLAFGRSEGSLSPSLSLPSFRTGFSLLLHPCFFLRLHTHQYGVCHYIGDITIIVINIAAHCTADFNVMHSCFWLRPAVFTALPHCLFVAVTNDFEIFSSLFARESHFSYCPALICLTTVGQIDTRQTSVSRQCALMAHYTALPVSSAV